LPSNNFPVRSYCFQLVVIEVIIENNVAVVRGVPHRMVQQKFV